MRKRHAWFAIQCSSLNSKPDTLKKYITILSLLLTERAVLERKTFLISGKTGTGVSEYSS